MIKCGGTAHVQDATPEVQNICDEIKPQAEKKAGKKFNLFHAKKFTTQVVAGTVYFIQVEVGKDECINVRVFKPLANGKLELQGLETSKTLKDPIGYF
ncbi:hypothetical protein UPYG_G00116500 [Umbra pygmaea]|uniref:Cystatin-B n=1 Tax=Umbra pygmaea TaxID=75934 RepID=A0ABD0X3X2_UMBPY